MCNRAAERASGFRARAQPRASIAGGLPVRGCLLAGWLLALVACGAHASTAGRPAEAPSAPADGAYRATPVMMMDQQASGEDLEAEELLPAAPASNAQSSAQESAGSAPAGPLPPAATAQASPQSVKPATQIDAAHTGPLLIYMASFQLHVYEVAKAQTELKAAAKRLGGFVSEETDVALTLRVPSARFEEALAAVESTGKVRARHVQALDVGEQYRDLSVRLRTAEALRDRLEAMLARAARVEEALQVERELERIVREIEQLKGQLRVMGDRIALSTITVDFRPEARPELDGSDAFRLPYPWLDELGLHHLLELDQ